MSKFLGIGTGEEWGVVGEQCIKGVAGFLVRWLRIIHWRGSRHRERERETGERERGELTKVLRKVNSTE